MNKRMHYFEQNQINTNTAMSKVPLQLLPQETDWTCSIACIRTILSGIIKNVPSEQELIKCYSLSPGPHYSKDIEKYGILDSYDVIYGCNLEQKSFDLVLDYMREGYFLMLESMYNYAHWMVLLGFFPIDNSDIEKSKLLFYDPYYNQVRMLCVDEFISMWIDGNHKDNGIEKDFIAIKSFDE